jgi:hypothetical protein
MLDHLKSFDSSSSNQALLYPSAVSVSSAVMTSSLSWCFLRQLVARGLYYLVSSSALAFCMDACRAEPVRQELPAAVGELPPAGHQARAVHHRGAEVHRPAPRHRRKQVRPTTSLFDPCTSAFSALRLHCRQEYCSVQRAIAAKESSH